jgi:hypothetical protein
MLIVSSSLPNDVETIKAMLVAERGCQQCFRRKQLKFLQDLNVCEDLAVILLMLNGL